MRKTQILIVEDETELSQANKNYLEQQGYVVYTASTLAEARALIWERPPDLILLDVMMPDGSGHAFCGEIRKMTAVPIIYLSCLGSDADIVCGLAEGGDDYITKPYSLEVLGARVAAQLRRWGRGSNNIDLPPLSLDLTKGTATLDGRPLALTRKEFQLLTFLVDHRGQEFTPSQLYTAVWDGPSASMGSTVKVHISRLRQKLRLDDASPFELCATEGQGYMFLRVRYPAED